MATQAFRLASASDGQATLDMLYDDATMTCTGFQWSNPFRAGTVTIWNPSGAVVFDGTAVGPGSATLRKNQQFTVSFATGGVVLPAFSFGIST